MDKKESERHFPFKLHYFPQISVDGSEQLVGTLETSKDFRQRGAHVQKKEENNTHIQENDKDDDKQESLQEIIERAFEDGYEKGSVEGAHSERMRFLSSIKALDEVISAFKDLEKNAVIEGEEAVLGLSVHIAKKIIKKEIVESPDSISGIIRSALSHVLEHRNIMIRMNPSDHDLLMSQYDQNKEFLQEFKDIHFISDERISSGGCVIESDFGSVDARIETQMNIIENEIKSKLYEERQGIKKT